MMLKLSLILIAALVSVCTFCKTADAAAVRQMHHRSAEQIHPAKQYACPSHAVIEADLGKASYSLEQAQYHDATRVLNSPSLLPCDPRVSLLLAAVFEKEGDLPSAEHVLQRSHAIWPANDSIAASLAREYLSSGQTAKALQALADFRATPTTRLQEMQMATVVYLAGNKLLMAQAVAETAYKAYPSLDTLLLLANVLQLEGKYPIVVRLLNKKREACANSARFLITLAESEYDASMWVSARRDIERAISIHPSMFQAHYILGNVLVRQGNLNQAIREYQQAIKLAPSEPRTYFHLALVYRTKNDTVAEEHILDQALAANAHYAPAQCEMGRILIMQGRLHDAVDHLKLAVEYNPDSEEGYFLLVKAFARLGETDQAKAMVKRLVAIRKANRPWNHAHDSGSTPQPGKGNAN